MSLNPDFETSSIYFYRKSMVFLVFDKFGFGSIVQY